MYPRAPNGWAMRASRLASVRFRGSLGQSKSGHAEFEEYIDFVRRAFPDFSNEIEEVISEGDKAFARLTYRGTHRGELFNIAATGRRIQHASAAVFRFRGDKIDEVCSPG